MNAPTDSPDLLIPAAPINSFQEFVRLHPATALLAAAGLGFVAVLFARAVAPKPPPQNRAARLLEDIQHRLGELAQPAYDKLAGLAEGGAHFVSRGVEKLETMHMDRKCDNILRRFKNLFL